MAERHGMGLQELEGELRTETDPRHDRNPAGGANAGRRASRAARRAATGTTDVVWRRRRGSLDRAPTGAGRASSRLIGLATMPGRTRPGRSTSWSIDSAAAWRPGPCCEWNSFPTHSPSTWSGWSRGRTRHRRARTGSRYPRNSLAAVRCRLLGRFLSPSMWPRLFPTGRRSAWCGKDRTVVVIRVLGPGADRDGLVARAGRRARLLPRRMGGRHAGMGLSRPAQRSLVLARLFRLTRHARTTSLQALCASAGAGPAARGDTAGPLCRASLQDKLLLSGRSVPSRRARQPGGQAWLCRHGGHRSEQSGGCRACPRRRQGGRSQAGRRRRGHAGRCQPHLALGDEP